jgi:16S rRNA (cytidine1402-2'-O)-methyltransferase
MQGRRWSVIPDSGCCRLPGRKICDRFRFEGFLPTRAGPRAKRLEYLGEVPETLILYESVHRIVETLAELEQVLGPDREMTLARELTKLHETIYRGSISSVREQLNADPGGAKGEFTLVIAGCQTPAGGDQAELRRVLEVLLEELSPSQAASLAAGITGVRRNEAYRLANSLKQRC